MAEGRGRGPRAGEAPEVALRGAATGVRRRIRSDCRRAPDKLKPLLAYLEIHLFEPDLGVRGMALACGVRDHSIGSLFKAHLGRRPSRYISDRRLEVAEILLRDTRLPAWQIGSLVGYSQAPVFSTAFRRARGMPPGAFRNKFRDAGAAARPAARAPGSAPPTLPFLRRALAGGLDPDEVKRLRRWLRDTYTPAPGS